MPRQAKKEVKSKKASSTKTAARTRHAAGGKTKRRRREQQRAIETRRAILDAALNEFAERGFEGASLRRIGERARLDFTLITYHYKNKNTLWRAVAKDAFAQLTSMWDEALGAAPDMSASARAQVEVRTLLEFTIEHTAFHHFMLQENHGSSPRLVWLVSNILSKVRDRVLPQIRQAQAEGDMLQGDPDLIYYMIIGMATTLSSLKDEMKATFGFSPQDSETVEEYWRLIVSAVFR